MLECKISFSLWWAMVKMAICTQKCEQKWPKINNRGSGGGGGGVNKDVLDEKISQKLTIGGGRGEGGGLFGTRE